MFVASRLQRALHYNGSMQRSHQHTRIVQGLFTLLAALLSFTLMACTPASQADISSSPPKEEQVLVDERLHELVIDGTPLSNKAFDALARAEASYTSKVDAEFQLPELPSGCEVTSLTIALRALGFDLTKTEIADNYLVIDGSEWGFTASPYEEGAGGFPPGIVRAANAYLVAKGANAQAYDLTGSSFTGIAGLVEAGYPVLIWTTLAYNEPNYDPTRGGTDTFYINEHCVVLYGIDGTQLSVSNPLNGLETVDTSQFAQTYEQCGRMAAVVLDFAA